LIRADSQDIIAYITSLLGINGKVNRGRNFNLAWDFMRLKLVVKCVVVLKITWNWMHDR
jgi:hypothetical protein